MHSSVSLDYKISKSGSACMLRPLRPCKTCKTRDNEEIMNCSCSQTVHGYRVIMGLSMNGAYSYPNMNNEARNYAQNKDVTAR